MDHYELDLRRRKRHKLRFSLAIANPQRLINIRLLGVCMTLQEIIESGAGEQRVQRLKLNAKLAKNKANQMKDQADASAEVVKQRQSREKAAKERKTAVRKMIKPYK